MDETQTHEDSAWSPPRSDFLHVQDVLVSYLSKADCAPKMSAVLKSDEETSGFSYLFFITQAEELLLPMLTLP